MADANKVRIEIIYDLALKELAIRFPARKTALDYQSSNPEARILSTRGPYDVWLPVSPAMTYLRSSSTGMAVMFGSAEAARDWMRRTILGFEINVGSETGVVFKREWDRNELASKCLSGGASSARSSLEPARGAGNYRRSFHEGEEPGYAYPAPPTPVVLDADLPARARVSEKRPY